MIDNYGTLTVYAVVHYCDPRDPKGSHRVKTVTLTKFHMITVDDARAKVEGWKSANPEAELFADFRMRMD